MDFMKTISYTLYLLNDEGTEMEEEDSTKGDERNVVNETYYCEYMRGRYPKQLYSTTVKFELKLELQRCEAAPGRGVAANTISQLFNNDDSLADVEILFDFNVAFFNQGWPHKINMETTYYNKEKEVCRLVWTIPDFSRYINVSSEEGDGLFPLVMPAAVNNMKLQKIITEGKPD